MTLPRAGEFAYLSVSEMPTSMVRDVVQVAEVVPVAVPLAAQEPPPVSQAARSQPPDRELG